MRFVYHELYRSMVTHWKYNLLILLELSMCVMISFVLIYNVKAADAGASWFKSSISDAERYQMSLQENLDDASFEMLKDEGRDVLLAIQSHPDWTFYNWCGSVFAIPVRDNGELHLPAIFEDGYEEGIHIYENDDLGFQALKSVFFSPDVFSAYDYKISLGRAFSVEDYTHIEGDPYPVILGSEYKAYFEVGDVILGMLLSDADELLVVGFLDSGAYIASPGINYLIPLDRYIIFPYLSYEEKSDGTVIDDPYSSVMAAFMSDGTLLIKDSSVDVQKAMNKITNTYGFPAIRCINYTGSSIKSIEVVSRRNVDLLSFLALFICTLSILAIGIVLMKRTQKSMPTYGMYIISGVVPIRICGAILVEMLFLSLVSILPSIWLSYFQFQRMVVSYGLLLIVSYGIIFLSSLPIYQIVNRGNLDQIIRRKSE